MQIYNLQITPHGVIPVVHVSQFDKGRELKFKLFEGALPYSIPTGASVKVEGVKSDKNAFSYPCVFEGNTVTVEIKEQMTALAETVLCELRIYNDAQEFNIGTLNFNLAVEKSPIDGEVSISDTEIPAIINAAREQVTEAENWASEARYYAERAENAAGNSSGGGGGSSVVADTDAILYDTSDSSLSSKEFVNKIGIGMNIGNYAENYAKSYLSQPNFTESSDWLTAIGSALVDDTYFRTIKNLGFGFVRIPVTWLNHWNKDLNTIRGEWLDAIENLVKMAIRNGLYVIINVHHDGGQHSGHFINDRESILYYCNLWSQIVNRFCKYGTHLIYELTNEITDSSKSMTVNNTRKTSMDTFNVQVLREIFESNNNYCNNGYNNNDRKRFIIVAGYAGLNFQDLENVFQHTVIGQDKLITTTHIYSNTPSTITSTVNHYLSSHDNGVICTEVGYENKPIDSTLIDALFNAFRHPANGGTVCIWDNNGFSYGMLSRTDKTVFNCCFDGQAARLAQEWGMSSDKVLDALNGRYSSNWKGYDKSVFNFPRFYRHTLIVPAEGNNNTFYGQKIAKAMIISTKPITSYVASNNKNYGFYVEGLSGGRVIYLITFDADNPKWIRVFDKNATDFAVQQYNERIYLYGTTPETYVDESMQPWEYVVDGQPTAQFHCTGIAINNTSPIALDNTTRTAQLDITLTPANTTDGVSYSSSSSNIASVDVNGLITGHETGNATITVTCGSVSDTITVNVTMPEQQEDVYDHVYAYDASNGELPNDTDFTISNGANLATPTMGTGVDNANCLVFSGQNTTGFVKPKPQPTSVSKAELVAHISFGTLSNYGSYISPFLCKYWNGSYGGEGTPLVKKIYYAGIQNKDFNLNNGTLITNNGEIITTNKIYELKMVADFANDVCQFFIDGTQLYGDFGFNTTTSNTEQGFVLGIQNEHCTLPTKVYDFTIKWND